MKQRNQFWTVSYLSVSLAGSQLCMIDITIHITKHLVLLNKMTTVSTMDGFQWAHIRFSATNINFLVLLNKMTTVGTMDGFQWAHIRFSATNINLGGNICNKCPYGLSYYFTDDHGGPSTKLVKRHNFTSP